MRAKIAAKGGGTYVVSWVVSMGCYAKDRQEGKARKDGPLDRGLGYKAVRHPSVRAIAFRWAWRSTWGQDVNLFGRSALTFSPCASHLPSINHGRKPVRPLNQHPPPTHHAHSVLSLNLQSYLSRQSQSIHFFALSISTQHPAHPFYPFQQFYATDFATSLCSIICKPSSELKINGRTFQIVKLLGEGGFSFVYLAQDTTSGRAFALKKIRCSSGDVVKIALAEVEAYKRFRSDHIIQGSWILDWNGTFARCSADSDRGHLLYTAI